MYQCMSYMHVYATMTICHADVAKLPAVRKISCMRVKLFQGVSKGCRQMLRIPVAGHE